MPGGIGDNKPDSAFDPKQLAMGRKIETEHTNDPAIADETAKDHLTEHGKYYTALTSMEKDLEAEKTAEPPPPEGVSAAQWDKILEGIKTRAPKLMKTANTTIGPSSIAGQGLIATRGFSEGDIVAPVVDVVPEGQGDMRSDLLQTGQGRYLNHSDTPNVRNTPLSSVQYGVRALRDIAPDEEITADYREAQLTYPGAHILTPEEEALEQSKQAAYHLGVNQALYRVNLTRRNI